MGIGLGARVYLPTFAPRCVTHSATLPAMYGIDAVLLGYRLQGSETRRLKVGTEPFVLLAQLGLCPSPNDLLRMQTSESCVQLIRASSLQNQSEPG